MFESVFNTLLYQGLDRLKGYWQQWIVHVALYSASTGPHTLTYTWWNKTIFPESLLSVKTIGNKVTTLGVAYYISDWESILNNRNALI